MNLTHATIARCSVRQERPGGLGLSEEVAEEKVGDTWDGSFLTTQRDRQISICSLIPVLKSFFLNSDCVHGFVINVDFQSLRFISIMQSVNFAFEETHRREKGCPS